MNGRVLPESALARQAEGQRFMQEAAIAAEIKRKNIYSKGKTKDGASVEALEAEASLDIDHSRKLARNYRISSQNPVLPNETDAPHTVARADWRAAESRDIIYGVCIGINDGDNCTILPRYRTTIVPSMPNASNHQGIHTTKYYANVQAALLYIPEYTQAAVRSALRRISSKLIAGTFPF